MFVIKSQLDYFSGLSTVALKRPIWHNRVEEAITFNTREEAESKMNEIKSMDGSENVKMSVFNIQAFKRF